MAQNSGRKFLFLTTVAAFLARANSFWVLGCSKPIVVERLDPIVSPGNVSGHVHTVMGGTAFNATMDYNLTQTSNCTTCAISKDLSNYWVPTVYFHAPNGSFISAQQVGGVNVYYQSVQRPQTVKPPIDANHDDQGNELTIQKLRPGRRSSRFPRVSAWSPATRCCAATTRSPSNSKQLSSYVFSPTVKPGSHRLIVSPTEPATAASSFEYGFPAAGTAKI